MLIIECRPSMAQPPDIFVIEQLALVLSLTMWGAFYVPQGHWGHGLVSPAMPHASLSTTGHLPGQQH